LSIGLDRYSSFGLQFALAAGAEVIALTSSEEKIQKVKALGAQHIINYKEVPDWEKEVQKIVRSYPLCRCVSIVGAQPCLRPKVEESIT
jgi:NADPH:quinone reductase-like Zn-dependent oxidoreductase